MSRFRALPLAIVAAFLLASPASGGSDPLATSIQKRLAQAGNLTFPMDPSEGYFEGDPFQPTRAYQTYAGLHSAQSFTFSVLVYKTVAEAKAMYSFDVAHVRAIGGDFHAFNVVREGRVLYLGSTAGAPSPSNPKLPVKAFHSMIALANGNV